MTAPMVDYKIHWLKMMSVPESRAVVGRHDGINGRDTQVRETGQTLSWSGRSAPHTPCCTKMMPDCPCSSQRRIRHIAAASSASHFWHRRSKERLLKGANPQG